jgi:hypothetical protein
LNGPERFVSHLGLCESLSGKLREKEAEQQNRQTEAGVDLRTHKGRARPVAT